MLKSSFFIIVNKKKIVTLNLIKLVNNEFESCCLKGG